MDEERNLIEFKRNIFDLEIGGVYRHIGMYGFRREALFHFTLLEPSKREQERRLEQMRALDNDISIRALITACDSWSVDTKEDLNKVAQIMGVSIDTAVEQDG
jgi:3-deoxy-manno-octulosonate cytidylyltransferase (CMP-KDO synthetase)